MTSSTSGSRSKSCPLRSRNTWQSISSLLIGALFIYAGLMHFLKPKFFMRVMPPVLPLHKEAVLVSGFFEILGGLGMLLPASVSSPCGSLKSIKRTAGLGLVALLATVLPANLYMASDPAKFAPIPSWVLYLRLPLQFVFMAWVNWASKGK
ncbi:MAG: DoxX family protein [Cyanobacteria bacterium REEB67]|nr:DoxX family protein [Cyanobacteria bacterium REEB67]